MMHSKSVLRVVSKLLIPPIILFALYVQFHGDFGPGGGFQAGVILASAFILYGLIFGVATARRVVPASTNRALMALGVLIYAGTGTWAMMLGGEFLDYSVLAATELAGQHIGIMMVELGVGMTVAGAMMTIFFTFAGQAPDEAPDKENNNGDMA